VSIYRFVHAQYALLFSVLRELMAMVVMMIMMVMMMMMMMIMLWQRLVKGRSYEHLHYVAVSNIVLRPH
jgi:hypothetical protein